MAKKQDYDGTLPPNQQPSLTIHQEAANGTPQAARTRLVNRSPATRAIARIEAVLRDLTPEQSTRVLRFVIDGNQERMNQGILPFVPGGQE